MFISVARVYKMTFEIDPKIMISYPHQCLLSAEFESLKKKSAGIYELRLKGFPLGIELYGKDKLSLHWPFHPWIEKRLTEEEYRVQYPTHEPPGFTY